MNKRKRRKSTLRRKKTMRRKNNFKGKKTMRRKTIRRKNNMIHGGMPASDWRDDSHFRNTPPRRAAAAAAAATPPDINVDSKMFYKVSIGPNKTVYMGLNDLEFLGEQSNKVLPPLTRKSSIKIRILSPENLKGWLNSIGVDKILQLSTPILFNQPHQ
jgi:hypothetical protein